MGSRRRTQWFGPCVHAGAARGRAADPNKLVACSAGAAKESLTTAGCMLLLLLRVGATRTRVTAKLLCEATGVWRAGGRARRGMGSWMRCGALRWRERPMERPRSAHGTVAVQ